MKVRGFDSLPDLCHHCLPGFGRSSVLFNVEPLLTISFSLVGFAQIPYKQGLSTITNKKYIMAYTVLHLSTNPGRSRELFGIDSKGFRFNKIISRKMGLTCGAYIVPFLNDDGYLCFIKSDLPNRDSIKLTKGTNSATLFANCAKATSIFEAGSYSITDRKDGFWITDCKIINND